jgi:hypothetical protein
MRRIGDLLVGLGLVVGIGAIGGYEVDIMWAWWVDKHRDFVQ